MLTQGGDDYTNAIAAKTPVSATRSLTVIDRPGTAASAAVFTTLAARHVLSRSLCAAPASAAAQMGDGIGARAARGDPVEHPSQGFCKPDRSIGAVPGHAYGSVEAVSSPARSSPEAVAGDAVSAVHRAVPASPGAAIVAPGASKAARRLAGRGRTCGTPFPRGSLRERAERRIAAIRAWITIGVRCILRRTSGSAGADRDGQRAMRQVSRPVGLLDTAASSPASASAMVGQDRAETSRASSPAPADHGHPDRCCVPGFDPCAAGEEGLGIRGDPLTDAGFLTKGIVLACPVA
jgi:hypothetical protein